MQLSLVSRRMNREDFVKRIEIAAQGDHFDHTSWGSILLHELGHVLNLRLTGDISAAPDDFLSFAEPFFPGLSTKYRTSAPEFFAHCFAMGVASRPGLERYDAFLNIQNEHKQLFDAYMRSKIAQL